MRNNYLILSAMAIAAATSCTDTPKEEPLAYPAVRRDSSVVDDYFGTKVADPYRWLEDDNSAETKAWVEAQNKVTFGYLAKLTGRDSIKQRLTELYDYERYTAPFRKGGRYFYYKNDGMQNQSVLYVMDSLGAEPRILIDPNTLSADGTVALGPVAASKDGKYFAYQTSASGSDWSDIRIKDLATGKDLDDQIKWVKFSGIAWKGNGFFYSRYDAPAEGQALSGKVQFHKVYYHKVGTPQEQDELVYWNKDQPLRNYGVGVPDTEDAVLLFESESTSGTGLYFKADGQKDFTQVAAGFEHDYSVVDYRGGKLLVLTDNGAPNNRLVLIDPKKPQPENWTEVIPQKDYLMEGVQVAGGKLVATCLKDVSTQVEIYDNDGKFVKAIELPTKGEASFSGSKEDATAFYAFTSFNYPTTIFKYDLTSGTSEVFKKPEVGFNPEDYEVKQVFYPSKDGTKVPMFIVHRKGLKLDGNNPTLLYGYGGFNINITPKFSANNIAFLERGGIYAQANMRGGGEYGEEWHKAGTKLQKQNVFDDFIAAAEYLIKEKYTSNQKIAISGRSNGGLLVGACMVQRPDLYKVALPAVGVLDMLRFHRFTIGWAWKADYGSSEDEAEFRALYAYSPLHNIKDGVEYPATLVTTADHDDRVVPAHSFKFISQLQKSHKGSNPVLIRVDVNAGHGAGKPLSKTIEENADVWAFVFHHLGVK